jgi:hypothetical protein
MRPHSIGSVRLPRPLRRSALWAGMALTLLMTACASAPARSPFGGGGGGGGGGHVRVYVQNLGFSDVRVYAVTPQGNLDLGIVQTTQTRTFAVPWNQMAVLSFNLDFTTDGQYSTRAVGVSPGQTVEVDIPADGGYATVQIR